MHFDAYTVLRWAMMATLSPARRWTPWQKRGLRYQEARERPNTTLPP